MGPAPARLFNSNPTGPFCEPQGTWVPSKTRELALDLFQTRPRHLQETSPRNTHGIAESAQKPAPRLYCRERDPKKTVSSHFWTRGAKVVLPPILPRLCVPRHWHTHTAQHTLRRARTSQDTRAFTGPRVHGLVRPPRTFKCVTTRGSPISLPRALTWRGRPRAPVSRASLTGGPGASARHRMAAAMVRLSLSLA